MQRCDVCGGVKKVTTDQFGTLCQYCRTWLGDPPPDEIMDEPDSEERWRDEPYRDEPWLDEPKDEQND